MKKIVLSLMCLVSLGFSSALDMMENTNWTKEEKTTFLGICVNSDPLQKWDLQTAYVGCAGLGDKISVKYSNFKDFNSLTRGQTNSVLNSFLNNDKKDDSEIIYMVEGSASLDEIKNYLENNDINIDTVNHAGLTALIRAADYGKYDIVKLLIEKGANVNHRTDNGFTAIIWAAERGHLDIVKLLVENGADINAKSTWAAKTPIMAAAERCENIDVISYLITKGANLNEKGAGGTVLDYAKSRNAWDKEQKDFKKLVIQTLINAGAK